MTGTVPIKSLWSGFELFVRKPAGVVTRETREGFADAGALIARALEELYIDGPAPLPPVLNETVFIHAGGCLWQPAETSCGWSEPEKMFLDGIDFYIQKVLQHSDFAVAGYKEPRGHDREHTRINPDWWTDEIKVDFRAGTMWAKDKDSGGWRMLFSEIMVWRPDWYADVFEGIEEVPRLRRRIDLKQLVPIVAAETPAAKALLDGKKREHGDLTGAVFEMMQDPRLAQEKANQSSVLKEFGKLLKALKTTQ